MSTVLWMALLLTGLGLMLLGSQLMLGAFGRQPWEGAFIGGAVLVVLAALVAVIIGARWWHAVLMAAPVVVLSIAQFALNPFVFLLVGVIGLIAASVGAASAILRTFGRVEDDVAAPAAAVQSSPRFRTLRIVLTVMWMLMFLSGVWLIFTNSFRALWRFGGPSADQLAPAYSGFATGAALVAVAAVITLLLGATWWQALLVAIPAFCLPLGLITDNLVVVWVFLGLGFVAAAMGGTGAVLAAARSTAGGRGAHLP
ncbi:hypothetical protein ACFVAJ_05505 [Agromyces sp. NPDC057679]|uniref:hypothetical protein n=1 Tax=Agromyces sp. NPDC057679 TaxID=3346207 RepID=UPI0036716133